MENTLLARVLDTTLMDGTIRPQDDYFRHINGTWLRDHPIPADRPSDGAFHALRDLSEERGKAIVTDAIAGSIDDPDAVKIATLYAQFMDEEAIEAAGATPLLPLFEELAQAPDHQALASLAGALARTGISVFFGAYVGNDLNDTTRYVTHLGQTGLGLPDESYYHEDAYAPIRQAYVAHIERALDMSSWAADYAHADAGDLACAVMDFETALADLHWDAVTLRDSQKANNPHSWKQIISDYPGFDWEAWATTVGYTPPLGNDLNVGQPDCIQGAAALWQNTPLSTLKAWLARKIVDSYSSLLSSDFVNESFDFYSRTLAGTEELRPRWKRAMSLVESTLGESLGRLWVERHFPPTHKEAMDDLVRRLLEAYGESIRSLDWMGEATKARALEKLATFNPKIGYPVKWRDYSGLEISSEATLVDNIRAAADFETDYEWGKLGTPVDRDEWFMTPQTVNAYYNPTMNEIVFPAAILQPPFFDVEADPAVNFGAIGAVIGHEIGHGFDDQGSQFDAQGNLVNWWEEEDRERFEERTRALIAQYDACMPAALADMEGPEGGYHVNGALTIGENIGDLGGLTIAWKAWVALLKEQGVERVEDAPIIDGLTGAERFFAAWARAWRTKSRNEYAIQLLAIDPHSPAEFRCNQVLANMDAFADTFLVSTGDALWIAPEERVRIW